MATTAPRLQVRLALADFAGGNTPLPLFEESVAKVLAAQGPERGEVEAELRAAVNDGTLPPESLRRLGLIFPAAEIPVRPAIPASAADQRIKPGLLLGGRYRLERELGEGGMGVVYSAVDEEVRGEVFAVKVMRAEIRDQAESLRLLRNEVRRTRALRHANIVGVYSLNSDPLGVYMLMEHLEGKSLTALLDEEFGRGMPLMRAWPVIWDIGAALSYAHDHNVIHSDLKPSNIFITTSGSAKLLDFGIARAVRTRSRRLDPTLMGGLTPAYASCEMFEGFAPDQSDDVYSLACVIYEMLTGRHPFDRMSSIDAHTAGLKPAAIPALTKRQNAALARALEFERVGRTRSVEDLLLGLKGLSTGKRRQQLRIVYAVTAVAAIGAASFLGLHQRQATVGQPPAVSEEPPVYRPPYDPEMQTVPKPERSRAPFRGEVAAQPVRKSDADALVPIKISTSVRKFNTDPVTLSKAEEPKLVDLQKSITAASLPAEMPAPVPIEAAAPAPVPVATPAPAPIPIPAAASVAASATKPVVAAAPTVALTHESIPVDGPAVKPAPVAMIHNTDPDHPPPGVRIPSITALSDSMAVMNSEKCPYPIEARNRVETGTVELLVHVTAEGTAPTPQISNTSGSESLDQAAIECIREYGRFPAKAGGKPGSGYWARTKFIWSFGG